MNGKTLEEHPLPPSSFICPLHAIILPENSASPEEGETAKKDNRIFAQTFCIIWTSVLWKQALLKIHQKDFRQETTLLMLTNVTFATGGGSLCNSTLSERCRQKKIISTTIAFPLHQGMGLLEPPPHAYPVQMHHYIWLPEQCKLPSSAGRNTLPWYRRGSAC